MTIVLIVEDEPLLRLLGCDIAQEAGFHAVEAENAEDALRTLQSRSDIRLVFTDIALRGCMDGLELASLIREQWPSVEIIVTSGRQSPSDGEMPSGAVFLEKPFDPDYLSELMVQMMQEKCR